MIVYADREEVWSTAAFERRVNQACDPLERMILEGQLESGLTDALCPEFDDIVDLAARRPERIVIRRPEGYAFYALYPDMYVEAAREFIRVCRPQRCVVVGIRSIGTSLSRVVADTVEAQWRFTVRPRGHPFDRRLALSPALEARIREKSDLWFLVVDEGPGLSGSSFMCVALRLEELGVRNVALFASHDPEQSTFRSEAARAHWTRFRRFIAEFKPERYVPANALDLSGGAWREVVGVDCPVQPQHERRKYLHEDRLWKFSGLGHFGRARLDRAQRLAPYCPKPIGLQNGFLLTEWVDARPAELSPDLLDAMAEYLVFLRRNFATEMSPPAAELENMIEVNSGHRLKAPQDGCVIAVDGRMLPQEWLRTPRGFLKADALDHCDDHFFPGCQDIAWDIAGAAVEWDLPMQALAERYLRLQRDASLHQRLPFYEAAYRSYRYGYCMMAAGFSGFSELAARYRNW